MQLHIRRKQSGIFVAFLELKIIINTFGPHTDMQDLHMLNKILTWYAVRRAFFSHGKKGSAFIKELR